jgi:hypothetical protein
VTKKEVYSILRPRGLTQDEWLLKYLEDDIKGVWPPGWMTTKQLEKMAKQLTDSTTTLPSKTSTSTVAASATTTTATTAKTSTSTSIATTKQIASKNSNKLSGEVANVANGASNKSKQLIEKVGQKRKHSETSSSPNKKRPSNNSIDGATTSSSNNSKMTQMQQIAMMLSQAMTSNGNQSAVQAALIAELTKTTNAPKAANYSPLKQNSGMV